MIKIWYECEGSKKVCNSEEGCEDFSLQVDKSCGVYAVLRANRPIKISKAEFVAGYDFTPKSKIMVNGYQSWTDTREFDLDDKLPNIGRLTKLFGGRSMCAYGDYNFAEYSGKRGFFHGVSYSYVREGNTFTLIGSLNERTGYTFMYFDVTASTLRFVKDVEGVTIAGEYELFNVRKYTGTGNEVFDKWFADMKVPAPRVRHAFGYTSWYNYYSRISQKVIERDINSFRKNNITPDIFQIDDGYQTAVGDWLSLKADFSGGMRPLTDKIHEMGSKAGLWLAPFGAQKNSKLIKEHPDWLVKDAKGKPVFSGLNWGGFYALDIYHPQVREYLKKVFSTVLNDWGFDMVKLDFLYCCCQIPNHGRSRGEIMCDAMDFLREIIGEKLILGCGVPMWPAFGKVDFCRTGADVGLKWIDLPAEKKMHRERVSTVNGVNNTIFRRQLDGRAFVNDPDVVLIRSYNITMSARKRELIARINKIFGNLIFVSDDVDRYNADQWRVYNYVTDGEQITVHEAYYLNKRDIYVRYTEKGEEHTLIFDVQQGEIMKLK